MELKLLEESAKEGFGFAQQKLVALQLVCGARGARALPVWAIGDCSYFDRVVK